MVGISMDRACFALLAVAAVQGQCRRAMAARTSRTPAAVAIRPIVARGVRPWSCAYNPIAISPKPVPDSSGTSAKPAIADSTQRAMATTRKATSISRIAAVGAGRVGGAARLFFAAAGALLLANTVHTQLADVRWLKHWDPHYQQLPQLVAEAGIHHAVIFIAGSRNAPPGEYPFTPLDQADVVYFRLGPLPAWGLTTADWRVAYERYFRGRSAYLYEQWALRRLEPPAKAGAPPR